MPGPVGVIRAAASALVERSTWMRQAGLTFDGQRDLYRAFGYKRDLRPEDYRARYERGGIAARIVETLPNATWRGGGEIIEDEDPDVSTAFEKTWDELNLRLGIWSIFRRTDILAGLGRYAIILIGAPGRLEEPLEKASAKQIMYLQPFAEEDAQITQFENDVENERYGLPTLYQVKRTTHNAFGRLNLSRQVHWSRVIHVADGLLDDQVFGLPRLQRVWNYLDDLDKISGGGAEAFWKRADQGMQIDVQPDTKFSPEDQEKLADQVEEYVHGMRRILRTRGVDINTLGSDVASFNGPVEATLQLIAATIGIPQRILMGSERGELASSQDQSNFDDTVDDRRDSYANPVVVRQTIDRFIKIGVLPEPKQYNARWPDIDDLNDSQRADMAQKWASLNGAMGETVVKQNEIRDRVLGLPPFTDEELAQMEAEKQAAAAAAAPTPPALPGEEPVEPTLETAATRVLALAVQRGRRVADSSALRAALANNDQDALRRLLGASTVQMRRALVEGTQELL